MSKKYWNNQKPPLDLDSNDLFIDSHFTPNSQSIGKHEDFSESFIEEIEWMPIRFLMNNPALFLNKIEKEDVLQGNIGNCYFLSAVAALCEFPDYIEDLFVKYDHIHGYYECQLYINGEWQIIILDSYFPVIKGTKKFRFSSPNGEELWLILLEKAWSKINGNYASTIGGLPTEAFKFLTGSGIEKKVISNETEDSIWKKMSKCDKRNYLMCASTGLTPKNNLTNEQFGLISGHAYTLIGIKQIETNKLVQLRNPWGETEWNGAWCDNSKEWKNYNLKNENKNDGSFFMEIKDFMIFFQVAYFCYFNPLSKSITLNRKYISKEINMDYFIVNVNELGFLDFKYIQPLKKSQQITDNYKGGKICTSIIISRIWNTKELLDLKSQICLSSDQPKTKFSKNLMNLDISQLKYYENKEYFYEYIDSGFSVNDDISINVNITNKGNYLVSIISHINETLETEVKLVFSYSSSFFINYVNFDTLEDSNVNNDINKDINYLFSNYSKKTQFVEEILIDSVIFMKYDKLLNSNTSYVTLVENQFLTSGIGFRIVKNISKNDIIMWSNDFSQILNMIPLSSNKIDESKISDDEMSNSSIFPGMIKIFLALKISDVGKYWFNIKSSVKECKVKNTGLLRIKPKVQITKYLLYKKEIENSSIFQRYDFSPFSFNNKKLKSNLENLKFEKLSLIFNEIANSINQIDKSEKVIFEFNEIVKDIYESICLSGYIKRINGSIIKPIIKVQTFKNGIFIGENDCDKVDEKIKSKNQQKGVLFIYENQFNKSHMKSEPDNKIQNLELHLKEEVNIKNDRINISEIFIGYFENFIIKKGLHLANKYKKYINL